MVVHVALWLSGMTNAPAYADLIGYNKVIDISTQTGAVRAEHHHDWSEKTRQARWRMISSTKNPFTNDNDYSYLRLLNVVTGAELFRRPVPALTHLWISPDSKYVVGLSEVKLWNPYQVVVFSRSGDRLFERNLVGLLPGPFETVTNWILWYKKPSPQISIVEDGPTATLSVEDAHGERRQFQFPAVR